MSIIRNGYAVEFTFEERLDQKIRSIWQCIGGAHIGTSLFAMGSTPHLSLAVFEEVDVKKLEPVVNAFSATLKRSIIRFSAFGTFVIQGNIFFLSPVPTLELITVHRDLHQALGQAGIVSHIYYQPGNWIPHCVVAQDVQDNQCVNVLDTCLKLQLPLEGEITNLAVVKFRPVEKVATCSLCY